MPSTISRTLISFGVLLSFLNILQAQSTAAQWDTLINRARTAFYHQNLDSANYYGERMYELALKSGNDSLRLIALGVRSITEADPDKTTDLLHESIGLADSLHLFRMKIEMMSNLSIHLLNIGNVGPAYINTKELAAIADTSNSTFAQSQSALNLANIYLIVQDYPKCIDKLKELLRLLDMPSDVPQDSALIDMRRAETMIGIGKNYKEIGQRDSAEFFINQGLELAKSKQITAAALRGYLDLCSFYTTFDADKPEGVRAARSALDSAATYLNYADGGQYIIYKGLEAELLFLQKSYSASIDSVDKLLPNALQQGDLVNQKKYYHLLYRCYEQLKQPEKALQLYQKYIAVSDSINRKNIRYQLGIYEIESGLKDKELENLKLRQKSEIAAQRSKMLLFGLILAAVLIVLSVLFALQRQRHARRVSALNLQINKALDDLNVSVIAKRNLVNFIAHDLRTPLQTIRINSVLLRACSGILKWEPGLSLE